MNKKLGILFLCFAMLFSVSLLPIGANEVQAASIGEKLLQPEEGWQRYDDRNEFIKTNFISADAASRHGFYENTGHHTAKKNDYYSFNFIGSKLRIIAFVAKDHSNDVKITIDGEVYQYSERIGSGNQVIVFEKLDLSKGLHQVKIESTQDGVYTSIDAIDIDLDGNLVSTEITTPVLEGNVTDEGNLLTWNSVENATGYNVKRATTAGGPYTNISSNIAANSYLDKDIEKGVVYYYVISAIVEGIESKDSNEIALKHNEETPVENSNIILRIHLLNNQIKEYHLIESEFNNFINWYATESGNYYIFTVKSPEPPFKSIKEYIVKDKIVWFEVKEY
ncbi:hypothetical protein [Lysinibacillus sp. LZ02]|uniref:hypothetical protein n=1 Tax=Lysinibacillus sp. LZ02 TaxID=3420668 RepID=UPI003D35C218